MNPTQCSDRAWKRINPSDPQEGHQSMESQTICPRCQGASAHGVQFCFQCGFQFEQAVASPRSQSWFCPKCGTSNIGANSNCGQCGTPCPYKPAAPQWIDQASQRQQPFVLIQNNINSVPPTQVATNPPKSRTVFIVLGLFFGALGVHNFYAGYSGRGAAQLLVTILGACVAVGPFITIVWAIVEIFAVSNDANGVRMT